MRSIRQIFDISVEELRELFLQKYGEVETTGWSPRMRFRFGYYLPSDYYEATVAKAVAGGTRWIDVGGGNAIFPDNVALSSELAKRAGSLVAVDPSPNVMENPYASKRAQCLIEDYECEDTFDLATFRMVAEHVEKPDLVLGKLSSLIENGGVVIIYTVNKYSPIPILANLTPHWTHFKLIRLVTGGGEKRHIFPVFYRMNTRRKLCNLFERHGFIEEHFLKLDDLSTTGNFRLLHRVENWIRYALHKVGLHYPEYNLLGVYRRVR